MDTPPIVTVDTLEGSLVEKINLLTKDFEKNYGFPPEFIARVPGRVNLIGEHIDYCGYAVFPMAIDQEILMAVKPRQDQHLELTNVNPAYEDHSCELMNFDIDKGIPHWFKYCLCGVKGIMENSSKTKNELKGLNARIHGLIPPGAGLSSSSAVVCAAALAFAHVNGLVYKKQELADNCARSERYIGTEGGGMDQAIAMLATQGTAKLIEFNPLRAHDTKLPTGAVFVIAHSLAEVNKAASSLFNCRVMECRLAAKVLARLHGINPDSVTRLADVQCSLNKTLPEMASLAGLYLHDDPYSKEEVSKLLEMTESQLENKILSENTRDVNLFKLRQRALHVFQEAHRVWQFRDICNSGSATALQELGQLMFDSHSSCRDLYECSHPQLDHLVEVSRNRCLGARLTGAGWGGCMVALVPENGVKSFIDHLKENYYKNLPAARDRDLNEVLFATQPGSGAAIFNL
ncbi:N-acetylgalactosamine kinase-like [Daphnia carinata]|uniref:N-acetylgalactosamine kinase-like n=1 Tax=Daphnia carinata TaxID=120202 RepID=UPI002579DA4A|nr:N-acetylgalactosamine kinase-like [Daphnia carinata]